MQIGETALHLRVTTNEQHDILNSSLVSLVFMFVVLHKCYLLLLDTFLIVQQHVGFAKSLEADLSINLANPVNHYSNLLSAIRVLQLRRTTSSKEFTGVQFGTRK